jgi:hypothetical protein
LFASIEAGSRSHDAASLSNKSANRKTNVSATNNNSAILPPETHNCRRIIDRNCWWSGKIDKATECADACEISLHPSGKMMTFTAY